MKARKRCFRETCTRKGKVTHECLIQTCEFRVHTCNFHRDRGFTEIQQHVIALHPVEYRAAKEAFERARRPVAQPFAPMMTLAEPCAPAVTGLSEVQGGIIVIGERTIHVGRTAK